MTLFLSCLIRFPQRPFRALPFVILAMYLCLSNTASADQFANPLDVLIADPHVLKDGDTYYLYGTSEMNGFKVWSSTDLVNWHYQGVAFQATGSSWGKNRFWAPEVIRKGSSYYLFYSAGGSPGDIMRICVAVSSSPTGPFVDLAAPLFDDGQAWIDAHVFTDTDGTSYLFCSQDMSYPADNKSETYVAPLNDSLTGLAGPLTLCITPSASWEIAGGGFRWNEAPVVVTHGGWYYLLYSGNLYSSADYAVGYATASSPLGPWTKYSDNPVLKKKTGVSGPGHCSVVPSPDGSELWIVYHTHRQPTGGGARQLAIDRIQFTPSGSGPPVLSVPAGPSTTLISAPSGAPPFPAGGSDDFSGGSLDRTRWMVFSENPSKYSLSGGSLHLTLEPGDTYGGASDMKNIFFQYPPSSDFRITAHLDFAPQQNIELAFVTVWQDHNNYLRFADLWIYGKLFEFGSEADGVFTSQFAGNTLGSTKQMRVEKIGNTYTCSVSPDGNTWTQVGQPRQLDLIDIKVGFGAASPGVSSSRVARFDAFIVEPVTSGVDDWALY